MEHILTVIKWALGLLIWAVVSLFSANHASSLDNSLTYEVAQQRNPDEACTQCHKVEKEGMHGMHATVINPNNQLPITCTNCHGNITLEHRNGVADAMRFEPSEKLFRFDQQNSVCLTCHTPETLRKAFWSHDVHFSKLSCVSCHQLHPLRDPMQTLTQVEQVTLCVECHSELTKQKENP